LHLFFRLPQTRGKPHILTEDASSLRTGQGAQPSTHPFPTKMDLAVDSQNGFCIVTLSQSLGESKFNRKAEQAHPLSSCFTVNEKGSGGPRAVFLCFPAAAGSNDAIEPVGGTSGDDG
jgi:hypothetical protein